ncbi:hypothetical protein FB45DRAFT_876871 [Roridomyces roridus]|uniref:MAT1-1-1 n=1 Tax=Roridomyces roridus TaxID=1738132 RepID=A0AAD7FBI8_9AGAR|nr:hypothetical protein FB45DRAFT_876871 [Roridomyces roridus]
MASYGSASVFLMLNAFFLRSSCTPWRFCVEDLPDIGVTEEFLKKYTSITSIGFEFISESDEAVYAHLSMLAKTPVAFPHLSEIRFGSNVIRSSPPFDYPFFLKMLQSRRSSISTAASIARKGPGPDPKTADALNALRQAGMSIFIAGADGTWHARQWTYKTPWVFLE